MVRNLPPGKDPGMTGTPWTSMPYILQDNNIILVPAAVYFSGLRTAFIYRSIWKYFFAASLTSSTVSAANFFE